MSEEYWVRENFPFEVQQCFLDSFCNVRSSIVMQKNNFPSIVRCWSFFALILYSNGPVVVGSMPQ